MAPIVSPVYKIADVSETARPMMDSTGRVCAEMVPTNLIVPLWRTEAKSLYAT